MHARIENNAVVEYPILNIYQRLPEVSLPQDITNDATLPEGFVYIHPTAAPAINPISQQIVDGTPTFDGMKWVQTWDIIELDTDTADANLAAVVSIRWQQIKDLRDQKTQNGGYQVDGNWYHSDTFSRTQQIGLTMYGANMPEGLMWKTMGGTFVPMTPTLAQQIFAAAGAQDAALFAHAEALKAQVEAAANPYTVDITVGWPATYNNV